MSLPKEKLTADQRREIVLEALAGANKVKLAERYGVARSWLYALLDEALADPEGSLKEVRKEYEFRKRVSEMKKGEQ